MKEKIIKDYEFEEEILSFHCAAGFEEVLIREYINLLAKYDNEFQHNLYIYEKNGVSYTIDSCR